MCLIVLAWQAHPDFPLIVAANRDEFFARPTAAADFWPQAPAVLAGRDLQAGGTWLGLSRIDVKSCNGSPGPNAGTLPPAGFPGYRFAALTNHRNPADRRTGLRSRGELTAGFLQQPRTAGIGGDKDTADTPLAYARAIAGHHYGGFNLLTATVAADGQGELVYCHNLASPGVSRDEPPAEPSPRRLPPGIHALSNGALDTPWPKLQQARQAFTEALTRLPDSRAFELAALHLLGDRQCAADADLPSTGVSLEWERVLSAIFVSNVEPGSGLRMANGANGSSGARPGDYGTRASTVLVVGRQQAGFFLEVSYDTTGKACGRQFFALPPLLAPAPKTGKAEKST